VSKAARLVVLLSGNGSNLQAIIDACGRGDLSAQVCAVISNRPDAYGLERARLAGVETVVLEKSAGQKRDEYDRDLARAMHVFQPDWVILAGWMRILGMEFLGQFAGRVVNLHPALPGTFPGVDAIERAHAAFERGEIQHTGVMVHLVPDAGVDCGPVLNQRVVPIRVGESLAELEAEIHAVEHKILVQTIQQLIQNSEG
jgi:phosphoribosylglycinamide formyltransferase 1